MYVKEKSKEKGLCYKRTEFIPKVETYKLLKINLKAIVYMCAL